MRVFHKLALTTGLVTLMATGAAMAACEAGPGSVRILANDFDAIHVVTKGALECASDTTKVTVNTTEQHKEIQVPALTISPAEYTVAGIANNSIVPLMSADLIRPLDDLIAQYGQDLTDAQLVRIDGKVLAIAMFANGQHLFYRTDILEQAGLEAPKTYEDVIEAAKVIREKGIMENPFGAADKAGWDLAAEFVNIYLGYGGQFFEPGSAKVSIDSEAGHKTLALMRELTEYMASDYMTVDSTELRQRWEGGEIALMTHWGSLAGVMMDTEGAFPDVAKNTAIAAAPTVGGGTTPAAALWWDGFSIAKNISDEDAAASFQVMMHALRPEVAQTNPNAAVWLLKDYVPGASAEGVFANAQEGAQSYPMNPTMGLLHNALSLELADFMEGREDAAQALADVTAAYEASAREGGFLQ
jgi:multiple sugar transport system substrate-binding protein